MRTFLPHRAASSHQAHDCFVPVDARIAQPICYGPAHRVCLYPCRPNAVRMGDWRAYPSAQTTLNIPREPGLQQIWLDCMTQQLKQDCAQGRLVLPRWRWLLDIAITTATLAPRRQAFMRPQSDAGRTPGAPDELHICDLGHQSDLVKAWELLTMDRFCFERAHCTSFQNLIVELIAANRHVQRPQIWTRRKQLRVALRGLTHRLQQESDVEMRLAQHASAHYATLSPTAPRAQRPIGGDGPATGYHA